MTSTDHLSSTYVVRGKVMFSEGSVFLLTRGGGGTFCPGSAWGQGMSCTAPATGGGHILSRSCHREGGYLG